MTDDRYEALCEIAGAVSRETFARLLSFESLFIRWSSRINLAAPSTLDTLWQRHVLDSAQLLPLAQGRGGRWLDLGSGGGFPGAVIAILNADVEGFAIHLVESNAKKAAFLQNALSSLGPVVRIHRRRIEEAFHHVGAVEIVTARALAPLGELLRLSEPWLGSAGATGFFHKGREYDREIEESRYRWQYDLVIHPDRIDPQGRILEISNLRARGADGGVGS